MTNTLKTLKQDRQALIDELIKAGAKFKGNSCKCPYHNDKKPSAGIYQNAKGNWCFKCHSCGASGDIWDVKAKNEGKPVSEILKGVRVNSGAKNSKPVSKPKVFRKLKDLENICPGNIEAVYQYINSPTQKPDMVVVRIKTSEGKTFRLVRPCAGGYEMKAPDKPWPLYNRIDILNSDTIVVVEGEKCVEALGDYGIVATTNPAGAGKAKYADWSLLADKDVILWPDNDETGRRHMDEIESILLSLEPAVNISVIEPTDLDLAEKEDVTDYIDQLSVSFLNTADELVKVIQHAKPKGVTTKVSDRIEAIIEGKLDSIPLPWSELSYLSNAVIPGSVTLLCGSPGASKSFMLTQILTYWIKNGVKACVYELEEDREFHLMRILAQISGEANITNHDWIKENPERARKVFSDNQKLLETLGKSISACPEKQQTLEELAHWAEDRAKAGFRVICIDPITAAVQSDKPWIADNAFLQTIKIIARNYNCAFVLVTHPTKAISEPDMTALAGGAAYSRFAQTIFWLQNHDPKENKVKKWCGTDTTTHNRTLYILKARNGRGHGLKLAYDFSSENLTLSELGLIIKKEMVR